MTNPPSGPMPSDAPATVQPARSRGLSVGAVVIRLLGLLPETAATIVVLIAAGIGLRRLPLETAAKAVAGRM